MIYIAGPFFNCEQLAVIRFIEDLCKRFAIPHYSPRRDAGILPPQASQYDRQTVFKKNYEAIEGSTLMLAVTRYLLPEDHSVRVCHFEKAYPTSLHIPDSGTIWEMGSAYALNVPVVAFHPTFGGVKRALNLMLAASVQGCIFDRDELQSFLDVYSELLTPLHTTEECWHTLQDPRVKCYLNQWDGEIQ